MSIVTQINPPVNMQQAVHPFELKNHARRMLKAAIGLEPDQAIQEIFETLEFVTPIQEVMRKAVCACWNRGEIVTTATLESACIASEKNDPMAALVDPDTGETINHARNLWISELVEIKTAPLCRDFQYAASQFTLMEEQARAKPMFSNMQDFACELSEACDELDADRIAAILANPPDVPRGSVEGGILGSRVDLANWERLAAQEIPFVAKHLPRGCVSILAAPGGTGKSMLALALAFNFSRGESLIPAWPCIAQKMRVLVLAAEDNSVIVAKRFANYGRLHGIAAKEISETLSRVTVYAGGGGAILAESQGGAPILTEDAGAIRQTIRRHRPDVVVVDPLVRYYGGNENSNQCAAAFMDFFAKIAVDNNCAVLLVHHTTKLARDADAVSAGHVRGGGAFVDQSRSALTLSPSEGGTLLLRCVKANYAPKGEPIMLTIEHGAIREVYQNTALVEADILAYLGDIPDSAVTIKGIVKDSRGKGKDFRNAIIEKHPWVTAQTLQKIAENLVRIDTLKTVEKRINNRTVQVLEVQ